MTQIKATLIDHMGTDLSVVNAARVSFGKKSKLEYYNKSTGEVMHCENLHRDHIHQTDYWDHRLSKGDTGLIKYLAKHKHMSPFGHCFASFHVKAPIFVARQLVKHKFLRWNEISRRYVETGPEFYVPEVWRGKAEDKKQGSAGVVEVHPMTFVVDPLDYTDLNEASLDVYKYLLQQGVAAEQARIILPQSVMTEWYWSGSLDAFSDMCNLRCKEDTQYESRIVADQISEIMGVLYPVSWEALTT